MSKTVNLTLRKNLVVFTEGDKIFIQPEKHAKIWDRKHPFTVKRAGSVIVIENNIVTKNLFTEVVNGK